MARSTFSPQKYIKEKGRALPVEKCLLSDNYSQAGHTICMIVRRQPSGKFMFANYLIDRCCLGIKDTTLNCNLEEEKIEEIVDMMSQNAKVEEISPEQLHNMVYAAYDWGTELGFKPPKEFALSEYMLDSQLIDDGIDDVEFGWEGQPYFLAGPYDDTKRILAILDKNVGKGNYKFTIPEQF